MLTENTSSLSARPQPSNTHPNCIARHHHNTPIENYITQQPGRIIVKIIEESMTACMEPPRSQHLPAQRAMTAQRLTISTITSLVALASCLTAAASPTDSSIQANSKNESPKLQMNLLPAAIQQQQQQQPLCNLGNDTYQIGERWNPNLPPFGVQVCVQCECIVRERKRCYEAKVTCRRITNECPIIDSCPDGKGPVTIAGQCCKSCQSTSADAATAGFQSDQPMAPAAPLPSAPTSTITTSTSTSASDAATDRLFSYKNERAKEYRAIVTLLPACPRRLDGGGEDGGGGGGSGGAGQHHTTSGHLKPSKMGKKPSNHDINGIDSRLAFKSLDTQSSYVSPGKGSRDFHEKPLDDTMRHDHQHPNDVQSGAGSHQQTIYESTRFAQQQPQTTIAANTTTKRPSQPMNSPPSANTCTLGSDTYQIGDKWNPVLPPHGVQVCVLCNCIVRQRKLCYEAKVTCRRLYNDCPNIQVCPDGQKPVTVEGQCCRSCQNNEQNLITTTTIQPERLQKDDRIMREYQTIMRTYPACSRLRDGERLNGGGGSGSSNSSSSTSSNNRNGTAPVKRSYRTKINQ